MFHLNWLINMKLSPLSSYPPLQKDSHKQILLCGAPLFFLFCSLFTSHKDTRTHSCQNVNRIVNRFLIFLYRVSYRIVYRKIHKHLIKFIKNYKYTYIKGIFIINFKYIQLMTNLFITYVIIFNKLTK